MLKALLLASLAFGGNYDHGGPLSPQPVGDSKYNQTESDQPDGGGGAKTKPGDLAAPPVVRGRQADADGTVPGIAAPAARAAPQDAAGSAEGPQDAPRFAPPSSEAPAPEKLGAAVRERMGVGDHAGALTLIDSWLSRHPRDAGALTVRAEALNRLGRFDRALSDAKLALAENPSSSRAWEQAGYAEVRTSRLDQALLSAQKAQEADPGNATAHYLEYLARGAKGDLAGAIAALERATALNAHKYGALLERVRAESRFIDPAAESGLGDEALRQAAPAKERPADRGRFLPLLLPLLLIPLLLRRRRGKKVTFSKLTPPPASPALRKYELQELIGRGGMGDVHRAVDRSLGRSVAVKRVTPSFDDEGGQGRAMLLAEARNVAVVHHPNIVDIYEIFEDGQDVWLVFEFVRGKTVAALLFESGRLPLERCAAILVPVCKALSFAHERGLVHRDLKPGNIMVGEDEVVKLMDFGIARPLGARAATPPPDGRAALPQFARTQMICGTPQYMAPEMATGVVSPAGDVYALGVTLLEMLTGLTDKDASKAPPETQELLRDALAPEPARRIQSVREFSERLQAAARPSATRSVV